MTSKERFDRFLADLYSDCSIYAYNFEGVEQIYKDLEVLEILKQKTILYEDNTQGSGYINSNGDFHCETYTYYFLNGKEIDKETYFKLKEWLSNE